MNLKEELIQLKQELETKYVIFYSDGTVGKENSSRIQSTKPLSGEYFYIKSEMKDGYERFAARGYQIDSLNMSMILGVLYNECDVNEDNTLKEGAKPANQLVHYYTGDLTAYTSEGEVPADAYNEYRLRHQTFIKFSDFVSKSKKEGLNYDGPTSFEELVNRVTSREAFDINLSIGLCDKKEVKQTEEIIPEEIVEPVQVEEKPVTKKRRFFR